MFVGIKVLRVAFVFVGLFSLPGCGKEKPARESGSYQFGSIYKSDKDAPIPRKLVQMLENSYIEIFRTERPESSLTDLELKLKVPRRLLQIDVFLKEKTPGTLRQNTRFQLPKGGGTVDLMDVVNEGKGVFYLDFDFRDLSEEQLGKIRVFYVSNGKRFQVHGKAYGAGCGHFHEITKYFHNVIRKEGMELAAADYRYLGQILGSFFFSFAEADDLHVGSASFVDSRYQDTHCLFPQN